MTSASAAHRLIVGLAFLMPAVAVAAPKATPILVSVAGLAGLVGWARSGYPPLPLNRPFAVALTALGAWAAVASIWAPDPGGALVQVARLAVVAAAGIGFLFLVSRLDADRRDAVENAFLAGLIVGLAIVATAFVYAKTTATSLWGTYESDPVATLNNSAVVIGLVAWPAVFVAWRRGRRAAAGIGVAVLYLGLLNLASGAAVVAPLVGAAGFAVAWLPGRKGVVALAAVAAGLALAAPTIIAAAAPADKADGAATETLTSVGHRLQIWSFVTEKIDERPLAGWGFDASRAIPGGHRQLAPGSEILPLHPHNAFLQARLELGLPGAAIVAALLASLLAGVIGGIGGRAPRAAAAGAACAYLAVASVSYGAWQTWWVALAWMLAALMAAVLRSPSSEP